MASLIKYRSVVRCGKLTCVHCQKTVDCYQMKRHIRDIHNEMSAYCYYCGLVPLSYVPTSLGRNRISTKCYEHMIGCVELAKRIFKLGMGKQRMMTTDSYKTSIVTATRFQNVGKHRDEPINYMVVTPRDENTIKDAITRRSHVFNGTLAAENDAKNIKSLFTDDVHRFWASDFFNIPDWLLTLSKKVSDSVMANRLEYHHSYNIDTFWAKISSLEELQFHHLRVYECFFREFCDEMKRLRHSCALLRYSCVCDKHRLHHVHFIMVSLKMNIASYMKNKNFMCDVLRERHILNEKLNDQHMKISPYWPNHQHYHLTAITNDMHLFNVIRYIGSRTTTPSSTNMTTASCKVINAQSREQIDLQIKTDAFIKSYTGDPYYLGSHYYVLRPVPEDAPIWFAAVSRGGIDTYVRFIMENAFLVEEMVKVYRKKNSFYLEMRHILKYFSPHVAIPLRDTDFLYYNLCRNHRKVIPISLRDPTRYIYLGKNEYLYLARPELEHCCHEVLRDIFFGNIPALQYTLNKRQCRDYDIFVQLTVDRDREHNDEILWMQQRHKLQMQTLKNAYEEEIMQQKAKFQQQLLSLEGQHEEMLSEVEMAAHQQTINIIKLENTEIGEALEEFKDLWNIEEVYVNNEVAKENDIEIN